MIRCSIALALAAAVLSAPVADAAPPPPDACIAHSGNVLEALARADYAGAAKHFGPAIRKALGPAVLQQTWAALQAQAGAYQRHDAPRSVMLDGATAVVTKVVYAKSPLDLVTACDAHGQLTSVRFLPTTIVELSVHAAPSPVITHVGADSVRVSPLAVASPMGPLKGALTLPPGKGPFPAVVLVGGSGPQDLNEAIGPNKPFRDLAQGLARAGVASLRYDKRTYDYGKTWGDKGGYDVDSEVTDDAVAAAQLLAAQPAIDPHRVFVLGHSLGAMLAPRIGTRDPHLAGLVMLAAPARSLLDVMAEQTREMGRRQGLSAAAIEQQMKAFDKERKLLAGAGKGTAPSGDFGHIPQAYWVSLRGGEQVTLARSLSMPMLLLQGESDFQVSPKLDFAHWEDVLAGRHDITFHAYPGLNHLFLPAGKSGSMADYLVPGHVAPEVVADVAAWIKAQPSTRPGMP